MAHFQKQNQRLESKFGESDSSTRKKAPFKTMQKKKQIRKLMKPSKRSAIPMGKKISQVPISLPESPMNLVALDMHEDNFSKVVTIREPQKLYTCPFCFLTYTKGDELIQHLSAHGSWDLQPDAKSSKSLHGNGPTIDKTISLPPLPQCKILLTRCDKVRSDPTDLKKTEIPNTGKRIQLEPHASEDYYCSICSKKFKWKSNLKRHVRIHTGLELYKCPTCPKQFLTPSLLTIHNRTHTGERPYECLMCEKTFSQRPHLKTHTRLHTGEMPYECLQCGKKFAHGSNCKRHERQHTRD